MDEINKPRHSAVYDIAVQKAKDAAFDARRPDPSEAELDAIGKHADALNTFGFDARQDRAGNWIQQGLGSPSNPTGNHLASLKNMREKRRIRKSCAESGRKPPTSPVVGASPNPPALAHNREEETMSARSAFETSQVNNHASAESGGITFGTGATVAPPGNATTWSRQSARVALGIGAITQAQFVAVMSAISGWEQAQNSNAKATLRSTGDVLPT